MKANLKRVLKSTVVIVLAAVLVLGFVPDFYNGMPLVNAQEGDEEEGDAPATEASDSADDGVQILAGGTKVYPDGTRVLPDGSKILKDGTKILKDGTKISPEPPKEEKIESEPEVKPEPEPEVKPEPEPEVKPAANEPAAQEEPAKEEPAKVEPAKEEPAKEEPAKEEPAKEEPEKKVISLTPSQSSLYIKATEDDAGFRQSFSIKNSGTETLDLIWNVCVDGLNLNMEITSSVLSAGQSAECTLYTRDKLPIGTYNGYISFDSKTANREALAKVNITIDVTSKGDMPVGPISDPTLKVIMDQDTITATKGDTITIGCSIEDNKVSKDCLVWSVSGNKSNSTVVDKTGKLVIAADETADFLKVTAAIDGNPSKNAVCTVVLKEGYFSVTPVASPAEGGLVNGGGSVKKGGSIKVMASANNGYKFAGWSMNGKVVSTSAVYEVTNVKENITVQANFTQEKVYIVLESSSTKYGTVSESGYVSPGGSFSVSCKAKSGYHFVMWEENGKQISTERKFTLTNITTSRHLKAVFEPDEYKVKLAVSPEKTGKVSGDGKFVKGKDVAIKATPNEGYRFVGWAVNGKVVSTDAKYVIKDLDGDISLTALMKKEGVATYKIDASVQGSGGKINPSGSQEVAEGSNVRYVFTPNKGYRNGNVYIDGVDYGTIDSFTFTDVKGAHSIVATFTKVESKTSTSSNQKTNTSEASGTADKNNGVDAIDITQNDDAIADAQYELALNDDIDRYWSEEEYEQVTGVLEEYNITSEQARSMIRNGNANALFAAAYMDGYIGVTVNNSFAASAQETSDGSFYTDSSVPNIQEVFQSVLTEDEAVDILLGKPMKLNLTISSSDDSTSSLDKSLIQKSAGKQGYKVTEYMDIFFMKTSAGEVNNISQTGVPMEIVFHTPSP